ncbi:hypothetical protein [Histophilus somni]|uniref:hypothetical protein n=1 Tax=Histophilus somni TaxID=731 RepID=UPI00201EF3D5|nr:hypothetical protein [Histophilus somni]
MLSRDYGKRTEEKVAEYFSEKGYWVYQFPQSIKGQPADLIVVKNNIATLIEVKHCKNDRFTLNRIEPNQLTTFNFFKSKGNTNHKIAIQFKSGLFLLDFSYIDILIKSEVKSLSIDTVEELGERLNE